MSTVETRPEIIAFWTNIQTTPHIMGSKKKNHPQYTKEVDRRSPIKKYLPLCRVNKIKYLGKSMPNYVFYHEGNLLSLVLLISVLDRHTGTTKL